MSNLKRAIIGLRIVWVPRNNAYALMWDNTVLHVGFKADMAYERDLLLRDVSAKA